MDNSVNIIDFGAKGNGVDSDVNALVKANQYVSSKGGGSIFFPATSQNYVIDKGVSISKNVNLIGEKTKISRYHNYQVNSNRVFYFQGNNIMTGFIYDGGLTRIPNIGIANEETYYVDFDAFNEGTIFYNNVFLNAKGTFIGGQSNSIIYGNTFGEYGDHCIYGGGQRQKDGTKIESENVIISNNNFTALTSIRDAVKYRNGGENIIVSNNTFDLTAGSLFSFSLGDDTNLQGDLNNISFSNNIIKNCKSVGLVGVANIPIGSTLGKVDNIRISNNTFDSCTGYLQIGGTIYNVPTNWDYFSGTNIDISNNTFNQTPTIHLCCKGDGLKVNITNNKAYGCPTNYNFITIYGNTSLDLLNNTLDFDKNPTLINSPYFRANDTTKIQATTPQAINICGNNISGIWKIYQEFSGQNATYLTDKINFNLIDNTFIKKDTNVQFGIDSGLTKLIQTKLVTLNNLVSQDGKITSLNIEYYPKQYLVTN